MLKCRICGVEDEKVIEIPYEPGRPVIAHEPCFIEWAKTVLDIVARRDAMFSRGQRVEVIGLDAEVYGVVYNVRADDRGEAIFDVSLDCAGITPDDCYIARACELRAA